MNKRHCTVVVDGSLPDETVSDMVEDAHGLAIRALAQRSRLDC